MLDCGKINLVGLLYQCFHNNEGCVDLFEFFFLGRGTGNE